MTGITCVADGITCDCAAPIHVILCATPSLCVIQIAAHVTALVVVRILVRIVDIVRVRANVIRAIHVGHVITAAAQRGLPQRGWSAIEVVIACDETLYWGEGGELL